MKYIANASAQRVAAVIVVFGLLTWFDTLFSSSPFNEKLFAYLTGLIIGLAVVDHLHGIRKALERQ